MPYNQNLNAPDYQTQAARYKRVLVQAVRKLSRLYSDQTHFIYELVQNAADVHSPTLHFLLRDGGLRVWNHGRIFTEADIEGICSVDESTKDLTQIGTHGIGFKAVYIWTDTPQVHSGPHHFRIQDYVDREDLAEPNAEIGDLVASGHTVFDLPFKTKLTPETRDKLSRELRHIHPWTLLFLHKLTALTWKDECQPGAGTRRRTATPHPILSGAQIVALGKDDGVEQAFLVFDKPVVPPQDVIAGLIEGAETERERERIESSGREPQPIEIAFALREGCIYPQDDSVLFSYLPTEIQTGLRFLVQARYQTTPARDNIAASRDSAWNEWLIRETAAFLPTVLERLRDAGLLTPTVFDTLPNGADKARIGDSVRHVFDPIVTDLLAALRTDAFVPTNSHRFLPSANVFAPHRAELTDLFSATDLSGVAGAEWLDPGIAWSGRAGTLLREAGVQEIGAKQVSHWLAAQDPAWFEARKADWLNRLYRYLVTQKPEWAAVKSLPLVRLRDGSHTAPAQQVVFFPPDGDGGDEALASYMEGLPILSADTDLSALRSEIRSMLAEWGVRPPQPADIIDAALLPEHRTRASWPQTTLHAHLWLLVRLMARLGEADRQRLLPNLRADFTLATHTRADEESLVTAEPRQTYLPQSYTGNGDLEHYFQPSPDTLFLNPGYLGPDVDREATIKLLREIGVADLPRHQQGKDSPLTSLEEQAIQGRGQTVSCVNWRLDGLPAVLTAIGEATDPDFGLVQVLWRTLQRVRARRGAQFFVGKYRWQHYSVNEQAVDPTFVRQLKQSPWLPDQDGTLRCPNQLHANTPDNRSLLGDSVNYLHSAFTLTDTPAQQFAEWLGVHLTATPKEVYGHLDRLSRWAGDAALTEPLYRFLARQVMADVKAAFVGKPWVFTGIPAASWRTTAQVFWKNESAVFGDQRGYLEDTYPAPLKAFFVSIGVPAEAALTHCLNALEECARKGWADADTRQRLHALYRRIWLHLQTSEDNPDEAEREHWKRVTSGRNWLGQRGSEWGFYDRSALVVADVEYIGNLFAGRLPFWGFGDLTPFAERYGVARCSTAVRSFHPVGRTEGVPEWSERLEQLVPYIRAFLHPQSPRLSAARNENADPTRLGRVVVRRIERARVEYTLKGQTVEDTTPSLSHLEAATDTLWLAWRADEEEYPDLIGDALQDHFGTAQLSHFVSQLLSCSEGRLKFALQGWNRKGLNLRSVASSDAKTQAAEGDPNGPTASSGEAPNAPSTAAPDAERENRPDHVDDDPSDGHAVSLPISAMTTPPLVPANRATGAAPDSGQSAPAETPPSAAVPVERTTASANGTATSLSGTEGATTERIRADVPGTTIQTVGDGGSHGHFAVAPRMGGGGTGGHGSHGHGGGTGGEGQAHLRLKTHLARNPSLLGLGLTLVQEEYVFKSGDKVDLLFLDRDGSPVTVEVEAAIAPNVPFGIWQASKYQHLAAAAYGRDCRSVRTVVVAPRFPDDALQEARMLGVECFVHPLLPAADGPPVQD